MKSCQGLRLRRIAPHYLVPGRKSKRKKAFKKQTPNASDAQAQQSQADSEGSGAEELSRIPAQLSASHQDRYRYIVPRIKPIASCARPLQNASYRGPPVKYQPGDPPVGFFWASLVLANSGMFFVFIQDEQLCVLFVLLCRDWADSIPKVARQETVGLVAQNLTMSSTDVRLDDTQVTKTSEASWGMSSTQCHPPRGGKALRGPRPEPAKPGISGSYNVTPNKARRILCRHIHTHGPFVLSLLSMATASSRIGQSNKSGCARLPLQGELAAPSCAFSRLSGRHEEAKVERNGAIRVA